MTVHFTPDPEQTGIHFTPEPGGVTPDLLEAASRALRPEPVGMPAPDTTWPGEAKRALTRGSFRAAAAGPGALASAIEIGSQIPGGWYPHTPEVSAEQQETARKLHRVAGDIYQAASAPSLRPQKKGVGGFILNTALETIPVLTASTGAAFVTGPAGAFAVGAATMGETAYQGAIAKGASPETANTERLIVGMIGGAIEQLQAAEVLKLGKGSVRAIIQAARERALAKAGKELGKMTAEQLAGAASEGLEEALQEATQIGAATLHGEKIATMENLKQIGTAALGGATAGGLLKTGRTAMGGRRAIRKPEAGPVKALGKAIRSFDNMREAEQWAEAQNFARGHTVVKEGEGDFVVYASQTPAPEINLQRFPPPEDTSSAGVETAPIKWRGRWRAGQEEPAAPTTPVEESPTLQSLWSEVRQDTPGKPLVPTPQVFRQALINRHISLYQAFENSRPGGPRQQQLIKDIYEVTRGINELDGITDPLEGRPTVPPEYEAAKAKRPSVLEKVAKAEKMTAEEVAAFDEAQAKARTVREQQEAADAWYATRTEPPVMPEGQRPPRAPVAEAIASEPITTVAAPPTEIPTRPPVGTTSAGAGVSIPVVESAPTAGVKPRTQRGLEISIHKLAKQAGLSKDQYHDALEKAVGKRSIKGLSREELETAAGYFQQNYGAAPAETPVLVAGQPTTMESVIGEAIKTATNLKPQKRTLRKRIGLGSNYGLRSILHKAGRFAFGDYNTAPYYSAKVLDGGNENGVFSRVLDQNIQQGNSIRASLITTLGRTAQEARKAAGITPADLAHMSRAVNPSFKIQERISPKTEIVRVKIGGRTWSFTYGRLLNFYGQTSQVDPQTGEQLGREYAKKYGIRLDDQFTGPLADGEIDYLRSLVEKNPKAMAELDIEWNVTGPARAQAVNEISRQTEGRDIATIPQWYHLEISRLRRVPGKTVETKTEAPEPKSVESAIDEGAKQFRIDMTENQNIFKARRGGGRGPLVVRDHFEVTNAVNHAVAEYYGFALPFRTARTLLNHPDVQRELDTKGYKETRDLLTELFSRIQGSERGAGGETGVFKKLRSNFYRAVVNMSPQVIVPQPTSILNYGAYADRKYMGAAANRMFDPQTIREMLANSPIAYERFHGGFGTLELGEAMESDAVLQAMTGRNAYIDRPAIGARIADIIPLAGGWSVAKAEFKDAQAGKLSKGLRSAAWWGRKNLSGIEEGSDAWMNLVRDRSHYLWQRSQQTWDPTNRSWISGHPNQAYRSLWFFRTYHEKVVGMWNDALLDYKNGLSTKAEFAERVAYPMASYVAEAIVRSVVLAAVFGDVKEKDDYALAIATSPLQAFPVFGTVMQSAILAFTKAAEGKKQRWRNFAFISSPMLDMTNDTLAAVPIITQAMGEWAGGDEEKAKKTMSKAVNNLIAPVLIGGLGVPVYNAQKFYRGWIAPEEDTSVSGGPARGGPTRRVLQRRPL